MVKVYAILLAVGFVAILVIVMGGSLAENLGRPDRDPNKILGRRGRLVVGAILGFSMGGMAAEFSPLDFSWLVSLLIAMLSAVVGSIWVVYATKVPVGD
jgi:hypothetical protein